MKKERYMTIEEIVALPEMSSLSLSEDGKKIAFVKTEADWFDNRYKNYVWIYKDGNEFPYKLSDEESYDPKWSPDSINIAYIKVVEGLPQLFIKHVNGYRGIQVTFEKSGIYNYKWSLDGSKIYFLRNNQRDEYLNRRSKVYGEFTFKDREYQLNELCYINVIDMISMIENNISLPIDLKDLDYKVHSLIKDDFYITEYDISANEDKIVFNATSTPLMLDKYNKDIYLYTVTDNKTSKIELDALIMNSIMFSPDDNKICYTRSIKEKSFYEYNKRDVVLEIYDLNTGRKNQPLGDFEISLNPISWTKKGILIRWKNRMVYSAALLQEDGEFELISEEMSVISEACISSDGDNIAYLKATENEIHELYLNGNKITNENIVYDDKLVSKKKKFNWKNQDGLELEGLLFLPHNYDELKKYPLVVVLGGPVFMPANDKWFPIEQFVEKGFIVFEPNKRGYFGYGNEFSKGDYKKQGLAYYEDVISGIDLLNDKGIIDNDNIGIMGFSEGGYTSVFCSLYSDRFKVASTLAGSNDWRTFYVSTSIPWFGKQVLGETPWGDSEIYKKTSTLTYIKNANTPTLILHKKEEPIEPLINALELYRGLIDMNVDTELVIFDGTEHYSGEPGQDRAIMKLNLKWFLHYMLGETLDGFKELE